MSKESKKSMADKHNPFEGKRVVFVRDDSEPENADGVRGHLMAVGDAACEMTVYDKYIKRFCDVVLSFFGIIVISPVLLGISLAIVIDDPGPVLFTQKRLGKNKRFFKLYKFRSMKMSTPHDIPTHMLDNPEQYITKVGRFLRAHSLDELPQLLNVLGGSISLVGPRPGLWNQDLLTAERDRYGVNDYKPGITGWAQINGRDAITIEEKARLDGYWKEHRSLWFDLKCLIGTVTKIGHDDTVVEGGTGSLSTDHRHYTDGSSETELIGDIGFGGPVTVDRAVHKRILITGKGSYIGGSFIEYAQNEYPGCFEISECDTLNDSWREFSFEGYDTVYHVAGIAHADVGRVSEEERQKYYDINTGLALEVAEKAKREGVRTFVFMSSMIVYGDSAPFGREKTVAAMTVPGPSNFYGDSKLQADVALRRLADDRFKVMILRPPMIYGKGSKGNYPLLAGLAKKLPLLPKANNQRSMLYIENLCEFLCQLMLVKEFPRNNSVLFPQNREWSNTGELMRMIAQAAGKRGCSTGVFTPFLALAGKLPGKLGAIINKAFGNSCYEHELSEYEGLKYQRYSLKESILRTEGKDDHDQEV